MRKRLKRPEDIKDIVGKVMGKMEKRGPGKKERILSAWQRIAGEKASVHSRPVSIRRKILTIEVDSSPWFYTLSLKKRGILKEIQKELKKDGVEGIRFRMGDVT